MNKIRYYPAGDCMFVCSKEELRSSFNREIRKMQATLEAMLWLEINGVEIQTVKTDMQSPSIGINPAHKDIVLARYKINQDELITGKTPTHTQSVMMLGCHVYWMNAINVANQEENYVH